MARSQAGNPQRKALHRGVKGPLIFSAVLAVVAGVSTTIFATGGGTRELRLDLGFIAAGIAFIVCLVISAILLMAEKPNAEHLGKGSGVHRSSSRSARPGPGADGPGSTDQSDAGEPRFGQRDTSM